MISKSKVLSVQKGVLANAKVTYASPKQSQSITDPSVKTEETNPYANLPDNICVLLQEKERQVGALKLIIQIIKSEHQIVDKMIVADFDSLLKLIQLLTNADDVNIVEKDVDVGCCVSVADIVDVDKVSIMKSGVTYNLKYSFPDVISILDEYKISMKKVVVK